MSLFSNHRTIKEWNEDDRPREKLLGKGRSAVSDAELLAILLRTGTRSESAVDLARRILSQVDNNLTEFGKLGLDDLRKVRGLGPTKAATIVAAIELGRRREAAGPLERSHIRCSNDIYEIFRGRIADLPHEEFWAAALNRNNKILSIQRMGSGGIDATVVDVRMLMRFALEAQATSLIVCHNHPSGNLKASEADIRLTQRIVQAGQIMDIRLLDHLIITDSGFLSFADEGKM